MRKLDVLIPIIAIMGFSIYFISQNFQSQFEAKPDYEIDSPLPKPLMRSVLPNQQLCNVTDVFDGDIITVSCNGQEKRLRLCGIDAPEMGQMLGEKAKTSLKRMVDEVGGKVSVYVIEEDRYGREVAEVWGEDKLFNAELVAVGLAYNYRKYSGRCLNDGAIDTAEAMAQRNKVGVWDGGNYQLPWEFRRSNR